jgi:hypothetical protein
MAGLDPAIHVFLFWGKDMDTRVKPAHDECKLMNWYCPTKA